ncbi:tetratricopeptide repeat protein [Ferrovibrio terrae]|uniref:tetratricopeptide repeat protein n=1 Tax=Ferrovibrio terrae TaxID=2594003 RepID=UPI003137E9C5
MANSVSDMLLQQAGIGTNTDPVAAANALAGQGDLDGAQRILQDVLKRLPSHVEAWFRLGQIHAQRDEFKPAVQAFKRVIGLAPTAPEGYVHLGNAYLRNGRTNQALQAYRDGLLSNPTYALLHFNVGVALKQTGDLAGAIESYQAALSFNPSYAQAYFSLGNAYRENNQLQEAEDTYRQALALQPNYAAAHVNLAGLLTMREDYPAAAEAAFAALQLSPDQPDALRTLSLSLHKIGRYAEGAEIAARALVVSPNDTMLQYHMGEMLYGLVRNGETAKAREYAERWKAAFPNDSVAQHMAAAVLGGQVPERAGDGYVRETFDRFANDFEKVLGGLGYRVPELLCTAITDQLAGRTGLTVLDAGCGTGLCAPFLRSVSKTLVGVDLSGGMLAKAQERKIYDALHEAELGAFLAATQDRYDIIVAADVFCYFGALAPSFTTLAARTAPQGLFGFTVEAMPFDAGSNDGYRLGPTGRYQHDAGYVKGALQQAGFTVISFEDTHGREEMGQPVPCFMVLAKHG